MNKKISIHRIVPDIYSKHLEKSKEFYVDFLGMELVMDMEWILTFASKENPTAQISILRSEGKAAVDNKAVLISIEVSDVDALYEKAVRSDLDIVYPITSERWGVRRFFLKDFNGATIIFLCHL